jgi:hypothetical protein
MLTSFSIEEAGHGPCKSCEYTEYRAVRGARHCPKLITNHIQRRLARVTRGIISTNVTAVSRTWCGPGADLAHKRHSHDVALVNN